MHKYPQSSMYYFKYKFRKKLLEYSNEFLYCSIRETPSIPKGNRIYSTTYLIC